ncbi:Flagellar Member 3 [Trypanosoma cruzi]|uniref:Flagellar Member 3 n=1 Tax=Trypanosoma cruzi TaxID=5693 RepID=A0A2V2V7F8_TRYCR|nr:Flagellar Member 3 [Trypanosoma cruzi]
MEARSRAIAEALRTAEATNAAEQARLKTPSQAESGVFAGDRMHGSEHADLAHEEGGTASGTMRGAESVAKSSGKHSQRSVSHASVVDLGGEAHGTHYAFLPDAINGVAQEELYLEDDAYFQELLARYKELVPVGAESTEPSRQKQLREQMRIRAGQLAVTPESFMRPKSGCIADGDTLPVCGWRRWECSVEYPRGGGPKSSVHFC